METEGSMFAQLIQNDRVKPVNICAVLRLDPDSIRLGLNRWRQHAATSAPARMLLAIIFVLSSLLF